MAQASLLHRQQNFRVPGIHGHGSQQLSFVVDNRQEASTRSPMAESYHQTPPMTRSFPVSGASRDRKSRSRYRPDLAAQQQYAAGMHLSSQQWPRLQAVGQPYNSAYLEQSSNETTYLQKDLWTGAPGFDHGFAFDSGLQMPRIVSDQDSSSYANNDLLYPESVSHGFTDATNIPHRLPWFPARSNEFACDVSVNGSDPETHSSHSPKSYTSDTQGSEIHSYAPDSVSNTASGVGNWSWYNFPSSAAPNVTSPDAAPEMVGSVASIDFTGLPRAELDVTERSPSSIPSRQPLLHGLPLIYENDSQYGSNFSYSQKSSPEVSPWGSQGQSHSSAIMPFRPRHPPISTALTKSMSSGYQEQASNSTSRELTAWSGPCANVPYQESSENRFHTRRTLETHDQRKADDEILLDGKRGGLTYKEISKKMHTKCAESTLRGRYRSLTKARKDRVRKPVWREKDVSQPEHCQRFQH
jgi:hypothetical protein